MILVTGGTGLVGAHLLLALTQGASKIRAIYRTEQSIAKTRRLFAFAKAESRFEKIEWIASDLFDLPALDTAFQGVSQVYHSAGLISFDPADYHALRKTNIEGTANMVNLALAHQVDKFAYVSSVAALGDPVEGRIINEDTPWDPDRKHHDYAISKYGGELEVWRGTQEGLDAVIINPGGILGEGFYRAGSGAYFRLAAMQLPYYPTGTTGFVDVKDVVQILITLMTGPIKNEAFVVVAANANHRDVLTQIAKQLEVKAPRKPLRKWMFLLFLIFDTLRHVLTRKRRRVFLTTYTSMTSRELYDAGKSETLIPFQYTALERTLERVCSDFKSYAR
ncbi:NAD-dependent epimerase/dehydratase family protein [Croceiramulus getboli]|nr:NAD-dependent epimerase/dehydratase family protein [Flavobacteriaceae bacterium YJPT1-3]